MQRPEQVIVVAGGLSFEREISLKSGHLVANALRDPGLNVLIADVDGSLLETLTSLGTGTVAFIALHGPVGEDGALQDVLDASGVPYVGSRGDASRLAFDKPTAKYIARHHGIVTPKYAAVTEQTFRDLGTEAVLDRLGKHVGYPLVVKPTRGGSAFGLSIVDGRNGLPQAMIRCFEHGSTALLEAYVEGTEVAVGVVEGAGGPKVLPAVEIVPLRGIYDFEARYTPGETDFYVPARISQKALSEVSAAAMTMHSALGLRHISRSDFIVDRTGTPQFLEITASPGLTETSVIIVAMREAGLTPSMAFTELVSAAWDGIGGQSPFRDSNGANLFTPKEGELR
jgi:D-alanine-D-alanine ligase